MEANTVCVHYQGGYCKWGDHCRKYHVNTICPNLLLCQNTKCTLRHPRVCKYFAIDNFCKFGDMCCYQHVKHKEGCHLEEANILRDSVKALQLTIEKISQKVMLLEEELVKIKDNTHENKIKCELCDYEASSKSVLKRHTTMKHKEEQNIEVLRNESCDQSLNISHSSRSRSLSPSSPPTQLSVTSSPLPHSQHPPSLPSSTALPPLDISTPVTMYCDECDYNFEY